MNHRLVLRRLLTWGVVVAAAAFLYATIARNWRELATFDWRIDPLLVLIAVIAHASVLAWGVYIWGRVLRRLDAPVIPFGNLLKIWATSNLTKYIPGGVWQFMTAAQMSKGEGLPAVVAMSSMLIHVSFSLVTSIAIAAVTLPLDPALGVFASPWMRAGLVVATLLVVHPAVVNGAIRLVPRALGRELLSWRGTWGDGLWIYALAIVSWGLYGLAYSLFVASLAPIAWTDVVPLTAVNALSFTAGYLAIIAPGGLGVRESAMTLLLGPMVPAGVAAVIALSARIWSVVSELVLAAAGVLAARVR